MGISESYAFFAYGQLTLKMVGRSPWLWVKKTQWENKKWKITRKNIQEKNPGTMPLPASDSSLSREPTL